MLKVDNISFAYHNNPILKNISFEVQKGEHVTIMGESGCGKSTLLKLIYGTLNLKAGSIHWGKRKVKGPLFNLVPGEPYMKYLSQDFDLMPVTTVLDNIGEFLSVFYPEEREARSQELLRMIEMEDFASSKIKNLSVGQKQRVALARVLAQKPEVLLLDEPFSHIDNFRKNSLRRNLFQYLEDEGITCITATHDYHDVLPFAQKAIVIRDAQLIENRPILELYRNPGSIYVASLFGEANVIPVEVIKSYADTKRRIIVYAHEFRVSLSSGLPVTVEKSYSMGSYTLVKGWLEDGSAVYFNASEKLLKDTRVFLNISLETINQRLNH